jgi:hypothetical protein
MNLSERTGNEVSNGSMEKMQYTGEQVNRVYGDAPEEPSINEYRAETIHAGQAMDIQEPVRTEPRDISINPLSSGYMVKVGCQSVAVETTETLIDMIHKYLTDPSDFESKWYSKSVRNRLENIK